MLVKYPARNIILCSVIDAGIGRVGLVNWTIISYVLERYNMVHVIVWILIIVHVMLCLVLNSNI